MHAELAVAAVRLTSGTLLDWEHNKTHPISCGMTTTADLFAVRPTHHLIGHFPGSELIGAFEFHPVAGGGDALGRDRALWAANAKAQCRLIVQPTHKGAAPKGVDSNEKRRKMRRQRSRLHYARGMRWTSQSLLTAMTPTPALGGRAWTILQHKDERVLKAFALWSNSTPGMIVHWSQGGRTHEGRSTTQVGALAQIPCANLGELSDVRLNAAAAAFDALAELELKPACQAHCDAARRRIDAAVSRMLDLPEPARIAPAVVCRAFHPRRQPSRPALATENFLNAPRCRCVKTNHQKGLKNLRTDYGTVRNAQIWVSGGRVYQ